MGNSNWHEKKVEDILKQFPEIKDERNPRDIYQNVMVKMKKKQRKVWIMPSVATITAFCLIFIIVANLTNWPGSNDNVEEKNASMELAKVEEGPLNEINDYSNEESLKESILEDSESYSLDSLESKLSYSSIYEEDLQDREVITYAIPDQQVMNIVPISILVPKGETKSKFEMFKDNMVHLSEEKWGLNNYYPLVAELIEERNEIHVNVPSDHPYENGSASEETFQNVLTNKHDSLESEKIVLFTEGKPGIEFGNKGLMKTFPVTNVTHSVYYMFYVNGDHESPLLVPMESNISSINDAFTAMKSDVPTQQLNASIPAWFGFSIRNDSNETLIVELQDDIEFENDQAVINTIEAMLLTAKDFGFSGIKFENAPVNELGKFQFNQEIQVPYAPNKKVIVNN